MSKFIKCKSCGAAIAKKAKACPHCGARNKKSIFKCWWFWAIIIFVFFWSVGSSEAAGPEQPELTEAEYKAACSEISFKDLARNPSNHEGELFTVTGEVIQVVDSGSYWELRINITPVTYDDEDEVLFYEDTIYALYSPAEGEDNILEDDVITIYGQCAGEETYTSILGESITLPRINVMYYDLISE